MKNRKFKTNIRLNLTKTAPENIPQKCLKVTIEKVMKNQKIEETE